MEWLKDHIMLGAIATATPVILWALKKYIPALVKKYADIFLTAMVNPDIKDPFVEEQVVIIVKAAMRIAEHTMSGSIGQAKMAWVVDYVCAKTSLKRDDVQAIAASVYDVIRQELKEHSIALEAAAVITIVDQGAGATGPK